MIRSILPGEPDLPAETLATIREMRAAGRPLEAIARAFPDLAPDQGQAVMRLAALLAPKRPAPVKVWKGKR